MTQQELVETICTQTGISKRDLARWIGTDHSVLCRYTAGTRTLPLKAMQQLLFLHQQLSDLPPLPADEPNEHSDKKEWQERASDCAARLKILQEKYKAMGLNREAAAKAQQLLDVLAADTIMLTAKKQRWIDEQRYQAEKLAADNNPAAQKKLLVQIGLIQKELEWYELLLTDSSILQ